MPWLSLSLQSWSTMSPSEYMFFHCHLATTLLQNHHIYDPCTTFLTLAQSCTQFPADESCIQSQEQINCLHWLTCLEQNIQLLYPAYAILNLRQSASNVPRKAFLAINRRFLSAHMQINLYADTNIQSLKNKPESQNCTWEKSSPAIQWNVNLD